MVKILTLLSIFIISGSLFTPSVRAQEYVTGSVTGVAQDIVSVRLDSSSQEITTTWSSPPPLFPSDQVILMRNSDGSYQITDRNRTEALIFITALFAVLVLLMSRLRGLGSLLGMLFSLLMLLLFLIPQILAGRDPLFISILTSIIIMLVNMYLAHGKSKQTHIALLSTVITLTLTGLISVYFVYLAKLTGLGSEEASFLQLDPDHIINLRGLLLGGMIVGSLGVLDDVTIGQSATIFELHRTDPTLTINQLIHKGLRIGREHVNSLVNTLVLAYAGAALPLFILLVLNPAGTPWWVTLNAEPIAEEIVRTLTGSIGLILAVPITTFLASYFSKKG